MITQISSILPEAVVGGITATVGYSVAFCNRWPILRLVLMAFVALLFFKFLIDWWFDFTLSQIIQDILIIRRCAGLFVLVKTRK